MLVVRRDGKAVPDRAWFGRLDFSAFEAWSFAAVAAEQTMHNGKKTSNRPVFVSIDAADQAADQAG